MRTAATIIAALMSAVLYFNKPDEPLPVEQVAPVPACDCESCECDIDAVIERIANIEATLQQHAREIAEIEKCHADDIAELKALAAAKPEPLPPPVPAKVVQQPQAEIAEGVYQSRWHNYDGKTRMQHAVDAHGIDIRGKSESQVLMEMDAYHDKYGPSHPPKKNVVRTVQNTQQVFSTCPPEGCPQQISGVVYRQQQVQQQSGGWYPGKLLGR